jgi:hypothetical protein
MTSDTTARIPRASPPSPTTHWVALRTGSSAWIPSGFCGSGMPGTSLTSTGPARNIDVTIPRAKSATIAYGNHRHRGDAADPVGNNAIRSTTAPTGTRKANVWSQTANEANGRAPGFVYNV